MTNFPTICRQCNDTLASLSANVGGVLYCYHTDDQAKNTPEQGVFVTSIPSTEDGGTCQSHIIHPCTLAEALSKRDEIVGEVHGDPRVTIQ